MKKKLLLAVLLCFSLSLFLVGCGGEPTPDPGTNGADADVKTPEPEVDNSLQYILDKGYFVVGLDDSFPPMGFRDTATDEIVGFDIDLAREVASRMDVELRLQPVIWDSVTLELNNKNIDVIWNGMSITPVRLEKILCGQPYMEDSQIIVVTPDSPIKTKADLTGKTVGIQAGSSAMEAVEKDAATYAAIGKFKEFDTNDLVMLDLKNGGVDAVVIDEVAGRYFISKDLDGYVVLEDNFGTEEFAIGFRKGEQALADEFERILDEMKTDGTARAIEMKWFGTEVLK